MYIHITLSTLVGVKHLANLTLRRKPDLLNFGESNFKLFSKIIELLLLFLDRMGVNFKFCWRLIWLLVNLMLLLLLLLVHVFVVGLGQLEGKIPEFPAAKFEKFDSFYLDNLGL